MTVLPSLDQPFKGFSDLLLAVLRVSVGGGLIWATTMGAFKMARAIARAVFRRRKDTPLLLNYWVTESYLEISSKISVTYCQMLLVRLISRGGRSHVARRFSSSEGYP